MEARRYFIDICLQKQEGCCFQSQWFNDKEIALRWFNNPNNEFLQKLKESKKYHFYLMSSTGLQREYPFGDVECLGYLKVKNEV